ncbi:MULTISPECIES: caspase family protein [unclassified Streptomyces]|uniref:HD domain-containing protein n=1 Tax=unclassified Streptomyces TaxID=2593676 RepID=UPI00278C3921|nr:MULTISPECIES: caspase family protein [unclassified Streptomyces]
MAGEPGGEQGGGGRRRALLIGVQNTPYLAQDPELADIYRPLDCVAQDVAMLATALEQSDYETKTLYEGAGVSPVIAEITRFLTACGPGDTALLYFTGHGVTVNGRDHLVLQDSQPAPRATQDRPPSLLPRTLLRADPSELLSALPQGVTAVVCLDICRDGDDALNADDPDGAWSEPHDAYWLYSCGPGQRSYASPETGSLFARALMAALSRVNPPTTFRAVADYAQSELIRLAERHPQLPAPTVGKLLPVPAQGGEHRDPVVCEGAEQSLAWSRTVRESGLWQHTSGSPETHERVKERLTELVHCVVESSSQARAHRDDPWADPLYPQRVEARLAELVSRARLRGDERLSPAETAALLAGAVVHEGIVTIALDELRRLLPEKFDPGPREPDEGAPDDHGELVRDAARDVCRAHSLVVRTTETLRGRGLDQAATAADHWLRHRFIADWDDLWTPGGYGAVDEVISLVVDAVEAAAEQPLPGPRRSSEERQEIDSQVRQVLAHLTVRPARGPRLSDARHSEEWIEARPVRGNQWRARHLAQLLWTAAMLAADPRRLPSVVVDHLGAHEPLRADEVIAALAALDYDDADGRTAGGHGIAVRLRCPHPALHAALEEVVGAADTAVRACADDSPGPPPLLRGLPDRVTTAELRPLPGRYKAPLERFRLAEDEIRPLLMGKQLYGDRMLAVRELYQNALDACRYRDMRRRYGRTRAPWSGEITFTQGWDGNRPYIECLDNGSGMTRSRLTSMFARAGKRYEQDPEFVQERREWRRAGLTVQPFNSRFGIGVFSYFMLADEVVVWTRPVDSSGRADGSVALRVDIRSGSGLLRINSTRDAEVPENGGTRVRLYLAETPEGEPAPSLAVALSKQLWVTDHEVTAREMSGSGEVIRKVSWEPGRLTVPPEAGIDGTPVPLGEEGQADAWLVQGDGQLLLDGVFIGPFQPVTGFVANLRERHSPVPSVDRNQLLSLDAELLMREILAHVPAAAGRIKEVSLDFLWELTRSSPQLAVELLDAFPQGTTARRMEKYSNRLSGGRVDLGEAGCLPIDEFPTGFLGELPTSGARFHEYEIYKRWRTSLLHSDRVLESFVPAGYPRPTGFDTLLFQGHTAHPWEGVLKSALGGRRSPRRALRALRRYAVTGVEVPDPPDLDALDDVPVSRRSLNLYHAYKTRNLSALRHTPPVPMTPASMEPGRHSPAPHTPLVVVSALHECTLGEAGEILRGLRHMDPALPSPPKLAPALRDTRVSRGEATLLASDRMDLAHEFDVSPPTFGRARVRYQEFPNWRPGTIGPVDLLRRSASAFAPVPEVAQLVERFGPLGFTLDPAPTPQTLEGHQPTLDQQLLLSIGRDRKPPWHEGDLSVRQLIEIAARHHCPLGDAAQCVNDSTPFTAVRTPAIPDEAVDWYPPGTFSSLYALRPAGTEDAPVSLWELVGAFAHMAEEVRSELHTAVGALRALGVLDVDDASLALLERQTAAPHGLLAPAPGPGFQPGRLSARFGEAGADICYIMAVSQHLGERLGAVEEKLKALETALPLTVADVPEAVRGLRVTATDLDALTEPGDASTYVHSPAPELSRLGLLTHARHSKLPLSASRSHLSLLATATGTTLPGPFEGPDADALADFTPDEFDLAAFDHGLLGPGTLGPLELVRVAGRFGWDLGRTYERYAPFACLGLDVTTPAPEGDECELVPDWRDVIVLTERLTGRAPAVTGTVPEEHIALCAEETDLDTDGVRERLQAYARLFGLTVSHTRQTPPQEPTRP